MDIFRENPSLVTNRQKYWALCMKPWVNLIAGGNIKALSSSEMVSGR
jgi:hypothetical protein